MKQILRKIYVFFIIFFTTFSTVDSLELILNDRPLDMIDDAILSVFAVSDASHHKLPTLPLSSLFPWMKDIEYLEAWSESNYLHWKDSRMNTEIWDNAKLIKYNGKWELHIGRDVFTNPISIRVSGQRLAVPTLQIWSAVEDDRWEANIRSILQYRNVDFKWRRISQASTLLADPPQDGLPHLILLNDTSIINNLHKIADYIALGGNRTQWLTTEFAEFNTGENPTPLALDVYNPETALTWLLAAHPNLIGENGRLPDILTDILEFGSSKPDMIVSTRTPLMALYTGKAYAALLCTTSEESHSTMKIPFIRFSPPSNTVEILRHTYAAIPLEISPDNAEIAKKVLADIQRFAHRINYGNAVPLPLIPESLRFIEAYERIGRVAISGQMPVSQAVDLINAYVVGEEPIE